MGTLKYTIIKSKSQYKDYCKLLEKLLESKSKVKNHTDEIELLTVLIEIWDSEHNSFNGSDPIELLKNLMQESDMRPKDLISILKISKGLISDILNYKKGLSKEVIRILSNHFKISQEAFNRNYHLKGISKPKSNKTRAPKRSKQLA